jgi:hypothetical protein
LETQSSQKSPDALASQSLKSRGADLSHKSGGEADG